MSDSADSLFTGSANINWGKGDKAKQWLPDGAGNLQWRGGTLLELPSGKVQRRDFDTGKPLFYDDGNPKQQIILTLQTNERDAGDFDDGVRRLYVACDSAKPGTMYGEIVAALRRGGGGMKVGCQIYVAMVKMVPSQKKGGEDRREWTAHFVPAPAATADGIFVAPEGGAAGNGAQVPQQPPQAPQGGYQQQAPTQPQQPAAAPPPQWQPGSAPAQQPVMAASPAYAPQGQQPQQSPTPPMGPQHGMYGPDGGPPSHASNGYPQQAPVQQPQQPVGQLLGYDAQGNPIYGQPVQQPPANGNPYASPGPVQQPQPQYAGNPYQQ